MLLALAGTALAAPAAHAYVAPGARIVSASFERLEQADDSTSQIALSGDGRHVVFTTRARNLFPDGFADPPDAFTQGGIFRQDLQTNRLDLVAAGDVRPEAAPDTLRTRGALSPSVSADGRFVAFSTAERLVPADDNGNIDVYVRDLAVSAGDPQAYDLVSARDGEDTGATYATPPPELNRPGTNPGADVTARSALSRDGRFVVFRTAQASDLPAAAGPVTPAQQVFVRDRLERRTRLVTVDRTTGEPAGGALAAAVISADGSTVSWVGRAANAQTAFIPGEVENPVLEYLLWRRVAEGPAAVTRRVSGISDLDDPACTPGTAITDDPALTGPCYGPLGVPDGYVGGLVNSVPALSGDGRRVAFLTNAYGRAVQATGNAADLWLTDMSAGVSRKAGTVELTRDVGAATATNGPVDGVSLSEDGRWLLMTSFRALLSFPGLRLVSSPRPAALARELYLVDLEARTAERASLGLGGVDTDGSAGPLPAISADGRRLAYLSAATNLFFGDANDRQDAFVADRLDAPPAEPPPPEAPADALDAPASAEPPAERPAALTVRVSAERGARLRFRVRAPAAGTLRVTVRGRLPDSRGRLTGRVRTLATGRRSVRRAGTVVLRVSLARALRGRLRAAGALAGQAIVTHETPAGARAERRGLSVRFRP